ncbi:MAG TPA: transferrin receptor-like dimerization domain-containing protein [Blastocatellia bacterium]|nr:transferrin receptor-like dimerization domain-containing protein [Blastocatellia bacterium]
MRHYTRKRITGLLSTSLALVQFLAPVAFGQTNGKGPAGPLRGYSEASLKTQHEWEERMRQVPNPELLREYVKHMSAEPHHIGSAYGKQNAQYMVDKFKSWGFDAKLEEFDVLFPTPKERLLEMIEPAKFRASLTEPALPEDPDSGDEGQLPTYNAYSADGDVTGQLVYVNYGIPSDYEELKKMGVDVKGKIVIARYGASWRGIKPKVAYENGAIGCLIYSDPRDDGFYQGDVFPEGAYRPEQGVQRGSVMDMPIHPGDPLTPGWGAVKGARRLAREEADVIMKIPVQPISYADALPLLKSLKGTVAPEPWRGALPITYHVGPGPAKVRLKLAFDWSIHTLYNVIARIEGSTYPDEWIVYGNHHDAWVNGASDPVSGMATVMEAGRAMGELLGQGWKPKRTIILCGWDGEEPSLLGSTEWAEAHSDELKQKAVAYLNSDSTGKGWLSMGGSHSLERFMNEVARDVSDPKRGKSVFEALKERRVQTARTDEDKKELASRADLRISALGSGSDYTPFIQHLGISSLDTGFGGEGGGGVYHSIYDSFYWYTKFSDGTFEYGRALSQFNGTVVMRLADADVLPFEFTNMSDTVNRYIDELDKLAKRSGPPKEINLDRLRAGAKSLGESAHRYEAALGKAGAAGFKGVKQLKALNELLYKSERVLTSDQGLPRRPWFKHQIYAPGFYTGYGVKTIPGVREAIEQKLWDEVEPQMKSAGAALERLAAQVDAAARLLEGKP